MSGILWRKTKSGILSITLNRPEALNALNLNMVRAMKEQITAPKRALVIDGAGGKAFCAGGDVVAVTEAGKKDRKDLNNLSRVFFREEYQLDYLLAKSSVPVLAVMDGFTMGGGVGISINANHRVATSKTVFAMPEAAIGLFCDVGGSYFLPRLPGQIGRYLGLTGARLSGAETIAVGVATNYISHSAVATLVDKLEENASRSVDDVLAEIKEPIPPAVSASTYPLVANLDRLNAIFEKATVEDILIALEKEGASGSPLAKIAADGAKAMRKSSPLSLKVIHEQLKRGGKMSLSEVFKMEYRMSQHFMNSSDFYEGVRARLVDKDQKPVWRHKSLDEVTDELVQSYFAPLEPQEELRLD